MPVFRHRESSCLCPNCLSPDQTHTVPFGGKGNGSVRCNACSHTIANVDIAGGQRYGPLNPKMKIVRGEHSLGPAPRVPAEPPLVTLRRQREEAARAAAARASAELLDIGKIADDQTDQWDDI